MPAVGERFNPNRQFNGSFIPEGLCEFRGVSPGAKLIWGRFYRYAGERGEVYPSMCTLGKATGMSGNQARRYIQELVTAGFIEVELHKGGSSNYYFLWHEALEGEKGGSRYGGVPLSDMTGVDECEVEHNTNSEPLPDMGPPPTGSDSPPLPDMGDERESIKESQIRESEYTPPTPSQNQNQNPPEAEPTVAEFRSHEDLDLADPIETFIRNAYSRMRRIRFRFNSKQKWLRQRLAEKESSTGKMLFRQGLLAYLEEHSQWLSENEWPLAHFLNHVGEYEPTRATQNRTRDPEAEPGCIALDRPQQDAREPPATPDAPQASNSEIITRWNALVPSCQITDWDDALDNSARLRELGRSEKFNLHFEAMCKKAEAIKQREDGASWLSFRWMIERSKKDGRDNWWKLASGESDGWAKPLQTAAQSKKFLTPFEQAIEAGKRKLEQEKQSGTNR